MKDHTMRGASRSGIGGMLEAGAALWVAFVMAATSAIAAPAISPIATDLSSSAERMVSYRHQERMWQTADGVFHLLVNRGTLTPGAGLSLFSSVDGGLSWTFGVAFDGTDDQSTGDGQLTGNSLSVIYPLTTGDIDLAQLSYNSAQRSWSISSIQTVFTSPQIAAFNPAVGADSVGNLWAGFVGQDRATGNNNIRMFVRASGGSLWTDTGLVFGATDSASIERSARPVAVNGGMGLVYTVHDTTYWAVRSNTLPFNSAWTSSKLFVAPNPKRPMFDIYASHFSVVADDQQNVHFVISDDFDAIYFRYTASTRAWGAPKTLNSGGKAAYCQIGLVNGNVAIAYSMHSGAGQLLFSTDAGRTFTLVDKLTVPKSSGGVSYGTARVEMPTRTSGKLPILQQYQDNDLQRLMIYRPSLP